MDKTVPGSSNPTAQNGVPSLEDLIQLRLSRRAFTGSLALGGMLLAGGCVRMPGTGPAPPSRPPGFRFEEISRGTDHWHHLPPGYSGPVLLRWGDPLFDGAPSFEPMNQSVAAQQLQFGYNNDFVGFIPLADPQKRQRGLLCVNHEYTTGEMMFPDWKKQLDQWNTAVLRQYFGIEMAAHGGSVVEIVLDEDTWRVQLDSGYNRRITATTPMRLTGPAAGHRRLRTAADATGTRVAGTLNNCAGGITPWGTWLMAEENFHLYFHGTSLPDNAGAERENHERYGVLGDAWGRKKPWGKLPDFHRFNLSQTPNEANRFGWIVEVDPLDPTSMPQKRTALGRFKHEGAETVLAPDGRLVVYMGDDEQYEYVYKFISRDRVDRKNRHRNRDLLDAGTLYVARFAEDGSLQWLPLQFGEGGLTPANGFHSQADVLIETRRAADLLGATPMDRPEDVEPEQQSGSVWVMLTNNVVRKESEVHPANPRAKNTFGHIIEIIEPHGDFSALSSHWNILVQCGDPGKPEIGATWDPATSANGWFGAPDNCAVDPTGRLWVATDGNQKTKTPDGQEAADGLWAVARSAGGQAIGRAFFRAPVGAEVCGPRFTPDGRTLFLAVQHPGEGSSFAKPDTRWPDFEDGMPPRPSVLAIRRDDGGPVGE